MLASRLAPGTSLVMENPYQVPAGGSGDSANYPFASPAAINSLAATRPWVSFCSIVGFVLGGLSLLACVVASIAAFRTSGGAKELAFHFVAIIPTLIFPLISLLLASKLRRYGSAIAKLCYSQAPVDMDAALDAQRRFWRVAGILLLICVILLPVLFVLAFVGTAVPA